MPHDPQFDELRSKLLREFPGATIKFSSTPTGAGGHHYTVTISGSSASSLKGYAVAARLAASQLDAARREFNSSVDRNWSEDRGY